MLLNSLVVKAAAFDLIPPGSGEGATGDLLFQLLALFSIKGGAVRVPELDAVIFGRVMGSVDHEASIEFPGCQGNGG